MLAPLAAIVTTLHVFSPWAGSIPARGVTIDANLRGSCSFGSQVITRRDAWHCSAGEQSFDPCFSNDRLEAGAHVLCLASPWEDATSIELTRRLPLSLANPTGDPKRFPPWAVVTANGERCAQLRKPLGRIAGLPVSYACAGAAVLLGIPSRGRTWSQQHAATTTAKTTRRVALREVWW